MNVSISNSEWSVLECLWEKEPQTVTQLAHALQASVGWAKSTSATMVSRMEQKGLLRFEEGRVVEYDAVEGRDVLKSIIDTDERACRLGECALVSKDTPIRESGLLFYHTLYDENASCHLALGTGFPECLEGGLEMDREELMAHGVNQSHTHVDFMIGTDDLEITGITKSGGEVPIFTDGRWAWSVA